MGIVSMKVVGSPGTLPGDCSDIELVARIRAGERAAEELLYRRFAPGILKVVTRLLASRTEAQDVLQDTFVMGLQELRKLRAPVAVRAWLLQIGVRFVHRRLRRRQLLRRLGFQDDADDSGLCVQADATAAPEVRAELALLDQTLARIESGPRIAWMLRYVEGHSLPEVADLCNCSLATAKRRISAADQVVRAHVRLDDAEGGSP